MQLNRLSNSKLVNLFRYRNHQAREIRTRGRWPSSSHGEAVLRPGNRRRRRCSCKLLRTTQSNSITRNLG
jgi:hypothetical protein